MSNAFFVINDDNVESVARIPVWLCPGLTKAGVISLLVVLSMGMTLVAPQDRGSFLVSKKMTALFENCGFIQKESANSVITSNFKHSQTLRSFMISLPVAKGKAPGSENLSTESYV